MVYFCGMNNNITSSQINWGSLFFIFLLHSIVFYNEAFFNTLIINILQNTHRNNLLIFHCIPIVFPLLFDCFSIADYTPLFMRIFDNTNSQP